MSLSIDFVTEYPINIRPNGRLGHVLRPYWDVMSWPDCGQAQNPNCGHVTGHRAYS